MKFFLLNTAVTSFLSGWYFYTLATFHTDFFKYIPGERDGRNDTGGWSGQRGSVKRAGPTAFGDKDLVRSPILRITIQLEKSFIAHVASSAVGICPRKACLKLLVSFLLS